MITQSGLVRGFGIVAIAASIVGCGTQPEISETVSDSPSVVVTNSVLCDVTEKIAQETVDLTCLVEPGMDLHTYEPSPSDRQAIETADLVLYGGYNLEPKIVRLIDSTTTPGTKVAVYETAVANPLMTSDHHDHGEEEHGHDHEHEEEEAAAGELTPDPHVWHNAQNGAKIVETVAKELEAIAPENAEQYQTQAATMATRLTKLDNWIKAQIDTIPANQRQLITTHDAFGYYSEAYNLPAQGLQGLSTESRPTAFKVKELVETIEKAGVPTVFRESTTNPSALKTVANEAKVQIAEEPLYTSGLGTKENPLESYEQMLITNTETIVKGLGGNYTEFQP